jgi:excinuclease ABC subunit A
LPLNSSHKEAMMKTATARNDATTSMNSEIALDAIQLRGVRTHNLKNIDLDLPHGKFIVITGPSGSGKSSLAFDTIFAEGQRQFIESLSIEARQHFDQIERPDADLVDGLQPTICIDQRRAAGNPRSTVGTTTEIYDYLRLLMARLGQPHCPRCDGSIESSTPIEIQHWIEHLPTDTRLMVLAPMVRNQPGDQAATIEEIRKQGYVRLRVDGELFDIEQLKPLAKQKKHSVDAVIDRLIVRDGFATRLQESIQHALKLGNQRVIVFYEDKSAESQWLEAAFSTMFACARCEISYDPIEPRSFSFNSPHGACPTCNGLGSISEFSIDAVIPDWELSLQAAVRPWKLLTKTAIKKQLKAIEPFFTAEKIEIDKPLSQLTDAQRTGFLRGTGKFIGLLNLLEKEYATTLDAKRLSGLEAYRGHNVCPACHGSRLNELASQVRLGGQTMMQIVDMNIDQAKLFFRSLKFPPNQQSIADRVVPEVVRRLEFLQQVGAEYLTLGRSIATLSGGEFQRVRLAKGIGSGLAGICYILDEPSIGLHQRDNQRLITALKNLQQQGNTLLVVEHDEAMMRQAEFLVDIGPAAGTHGGQVIAAGTLDQIMQHHDSVTARHLAGIERIAVPENRRPISNSNSLVIEGATANNLKTVSATIPLGTFTCVTGVSGSGKSSLINRTLIPALIRRLGGTIADCAPFTSLRGASKIKSVVVVDQSPIGRSPRSNAATYTGLFDDIRQLFAKSRQAKQLGFNASRFSFNAKTGRCEACQGYGVKKIEMSFLADMQVTCEVCNGRRFNRQTLSVKFKEKSIADVLEMPVETAIDFFASHERIAIPLQCLSDVGLGYLSLGQPASTISGGEAQRIKLATNLARVNDSNVIYFLDEPTTGLHFVDVQRLLQVLQRLVDQGNTVVVIEHNLDVVKQADWVIDLGPEGGSGGGEVVCSGTPEEIAACQQSFTGQHLREML